MSSENTLIHRREEDYKRHGQVSSKICRNLDPNYHPFHRAKEYTRALNATKLDRLFAKPFVAALAGSRDAVHRLAAVPRRGALLAAGDCEGELRVWNAARRAVEWRTAAHCGFVRGLCADSAGETLATCGSDRCLKVWALSQGADRSGEGEGAKIKRVEPRFTAVWESALMDVDFQRGGGAAGVLVTAGEGVQVWDVNRKEPKWCFEWGSATSIAVKFSPIEPNMLLCASNDRGVALYDARVKSPTRKIVMNMAINSICWNPMETFDFTLVLANRVLALFVPIYWISILGVANVFQF